MSAFETGTGAVGPTGATGPAGSTGLFDAYAYLRDEKTSTTDGGTFTTGAWRTRDLNTEVFDTAGIVSISANQFTLQAGTYLIDVRAPCYNVDRNRIKVRNMTDSSDALLGIDDGATGGGASIAQGRARVTIAAAKTLEVQHFSAVTQATYGFGLSHGAGEVEIYTEVWIYREA